MSEERKALDEAISASTNSTMYEIVQLRLPADVVDYMNYAKLDSVAILRDYIKQHYNENENHPLFQEEKPVQKSLLIRADSLINGQRQQDYGDKLENFAQIAMGFQMVLARKLAYRQEITPEDVALCMMQVKIARLTKSPEHKDSILDVAGYAGCYDKIQEERSAGKKPGDGIYDAGGETF